MNSLLPPNIHIIERGWLSANQVFLHDDTSVDVIDSGFCLHQQQTVALLQSYLACFPSLQTRLLVNTHLHSDHCGGNQALQDAFNFSCLVPESEFTSVQNWNVLEHEFQALGQPCPPFIADDALEIGQSITLGDIQFEIHGTPGHHPHSILLFAPALGLLISADALWEKGFGALFSEVVCQTGFIEQRATHKLIESLPIKVVVPGHGTPFTHIQAAINHAYSRLDYLESNPERNVHHVAQVLLQFMVMFKQELSVQDGLVWSLNTPLFRLSAEQLSMSVENLFENSLAYLENKHCLTRYNKIIKNCF